MPKNRYREESPDIAEHFHRYPNATPAELAECKALLRGIGKSLPRCGWAIRLEDGGREIICDKYGYYIVGTKPAVPAAPIV